MGKRTTSRSKMVLPLRIWGRDTLGRQFVQLAHTLDVSASGVRVAGFRVAVRVGEDISVQYRHQKAQFRVAWVGAPGSSREYQIGIEYLEKEKRIFGLDMRDAAYIDDYEPPVIVDTVEQYSKTRGYTRYPVSGGAEVRTMHGHVGNWGSLVDLSLGGCYVQTPSPLPVHTRVRLLLKLGGAEVGVWGGVRTCHSDVGMGIEFTDAASEADAQGLNALIKRLEAGEELSAAAIPKINADTLVERLKGSLAELTELEESLKELAPHADIARHYRASLGQLRTSAWGLQRWFELDEFGLDTSPVFSFLHSDRVKTTIEFCQDLSKRLRKGEARLDADDSAQMLRAVENLFAHLTGFSMTDELVVEVEAPPVERPAPPEFDLPPRRVRAAAEAPTPPAAPQKRETESSQEEAPVPKDGAAEEVASAAAAAATANGAGANASEPVDVSTSEAPTELAGKRAKKKKLEKRSRWKKI